MKINNLDKIIENYLIRNENKLKINSNDILNGDVFIAFWIAIDLSGISTALEHFERMDCLILKGFSFLGLSSVT